ncbi:MAG: PEPxxWA-CTERM sorting domain-containing protein [Sphingomonadaceae bacterium]
MRQFIITALAGVVGAASPATAANLVANGSFENGFDGWEAFSDDTSLSPAIVTYGASGIPADNSDSRSPDPVGQQAAYFTSAVGSLQFIGGFSALTPGRYDFGFSIYLPSDNPDNAGNASLIFEFLLNPLLTLDITTQPARTWLHYSGSTQVTTTGAFDLSLVFERDDLLSRDIVIDRVYLVPQGYTPPPPSVIPEPATWAMFIAGFGIVGSAMRRRRTAIA